LYNTRAVAQTTSVPADTFRAWERRYGLPRPFRTSTNQRLYSEQDIEVINWLRGRTDEGMTISQAIQRLRLEAPDVFDAGEPPQPAPIDPDDTPQVVRLRQRLIDAVCAFDADGADRVIDDALARYSVDAFIERFVEASLEDILQRRGSDDLSVAVEYFAARMLERRLVSLLAMVGPRAGRGPIVVASLPGEVHEVGLLVIAITLARRGWKVVYLGARVPAEALAEVIGSVRPGAVCIAASSDHAISRANTAAQAIQAGADRNLAIIVGRAAADVADRLASLPEIE
jgi:DNA-binding transcriptional MerR regulator